MKKILLILFLSIAITSCKKDKNFSFEEKVYQKILLETCIDEDCTEIKITTAEITNPLEDISNKINTNNLIIINDILSFEDEKKPASNYDNIVASFTNAYTDMVKKFPKATIPWQATANSIVTFYGDNLLSFSLDYYIFTGGANGFKGEKTIHYNPITGDQYTNQQLFKNYKGFEELVITKLKKNQVEVNRSTFELPENIFVYDDGLVLNFNTADLNALSSKLITLTFTKEEINPYLSFDLIPKANTNK
ncbi:DUF4163 domain-containing protein [Myroides sp. M-43]|uniref:PdaC/SigV domain-containing protein n=1 Tax=Myroides oncorhynchi TaxID=2893756 RepID=UPI001E5F735A|nr:DUF4163 domain-containing protein [Myroides oncorhynchi]MCC9042290.1 DUF4163 domain-containing protein [Myroides oncorhynchi]